MYYSFPDLEPACCSLSGSNCWFLIWIQVSQEASKVVWYSHHFKNFPVCCYPHSQINFVNEAEVDVFLESAWFFCDPTDAGNLVSGFSTLSKSSLNI